MVSKKLKPFTIPHAKTASRLAAIAEDVIKAPGDVDHGRLDSLEMEASYHQAGSKEAALFHVGLLARTGERLADAQDEDLDLLLRMHARLVQSLANYVEAVTGVDRDVCGYIFYLGSR